MTFTFDQWIMYSLAFVELVLLGGFLGYGLVWLIQKIVGGIIKVFRKKRDKLRTGPFAAASDEALVDMYKALSKDWLDNILGRYYALAEHSVTEMTKVSDEIIRRAHTAQDKQYKDMAAEIGTGR